MEKHKKSLHDDDITRDGSFERKASTFRNWISKGAHKYKTIFTNYIISTYNSKKNLVKSNFLIFRWKISPRKRKISFVCSAWMPMGSQSFNFEKNENSRKCYIPKCGSFRKIPSWLAF